MWVGRHGQSKFFGPSNCKPKFRCNKLARVQFLMLMVSKLTVVFLIVLLMQLGFLLVLMPWFSFGFVGTWDDNFLLAFLVDHTGIAVLKDIVTSGWVKGAVTGLGIVNILIAFWEIFHFNDAVTLLEGKKGE